MDALSEQKQQEIQRALHLFSQGQGPPKSLKEAHKHNFSFWNSQPVPKIGTELMTGMIWALNRIKDPAHFLHSLRFYYVFLNVYGLAFSYITYVFAILFHSIKLKDELHKEREMAHLL